MNKYLSRALYGLAILIVGGAFAFKIFQPIQVLPRIRLSPGFALTDQNGNRLTNEDLRGKLVLYTFLYTRCEVPCYNITDTVKEVQHRIDEANLGGTSITYVTISFDPAADTPSTMKSYAEALGADADLWTFATTDDQSILKTIIGSGFEVYYEQKADGTFAFDPVYILVDGWGVIRGEYTYQAEVPTADRILSHLSVLNDEIQNATGSNKLAYEAAHLFLCYAP